MLLKIKMFYVLISRPLNALPYMRSIENSVRDVKFEDNAFL